MVRFYLMARLIGNICKRCTTLWSMHLVDRRLSSLLPQMQVVIPVVSDGANEELGSRVRGLFRYVL
jgi:hypothetical protein